MYIFDWEREPWLSALHLFLCLNIAWAALSVDNFIRFWIGGAMRLLGYS